MRKISTRPLYYALLGALLILIPACSLPLAADQMIPVTQTFAAITKMAGTLQFTPTPLITETPSPTPIFIPTIPPITPTPTIAPIPSHYVLQPGEFPYCIARRFNVDPKELLALNNLPSGMVYESGLVLTIPQSGRPFPAPRALQLHPAAYTIPQQMTVHKLACQFGDVDPVAIMQVNGLLSPILTPGMTLQIP